MRAEHITVIIPHGALTTTRKNDEWGFPVHERIRTRIFTLMAVAALAGCVPNAVTVGGGKDGPVTGSAGQGQAEGTVELRRCPAPIATVALELSRSQNKEVFFVNQLPSDPLPAMRLIAQQSGCFRIVHRDIAFRNIETERRLEQSGELKKGSGFGGGQIVAADYTVLVEVIVSNPNAGGARAGAVLGAFGLTGMVLGGVLGGIRTQEAGVVLTLVDNRSSLQEASASGKASGSSFDLGGILGGASGGAFGVGGAGGYENTDQGKVVMGAMIDALNNLTPLVPQRGS